METSRDRPALEQARPQHIPRSARIALGKARLNHEPADDEVELILAQKSPAQESNGISTVTQLPQSSKLQAPDRNEGALHTTPVNIRLATRRLT